MGFLDGLKADLQKLQVERQRDLVVQLLHRRFVSVRSTPS